MARNEWQEDRDRGRGEWRSREWDPNRSDIRERPGRWGDRSGMNASRPDDEAGGYGAGMSSWADREREGRWGARDQYGQGSEGWMRGEERWGGRGRPHNENWSERWQGRERGDEWRDWGRSTVNWGEGAETSDLRGREAGWGGYGSYDRERGRRAGSYPAPDRGPQDERWGEYGRRGRFAGRGPKNYQRSDERIREDVIERLTDHPDIDATDIDVDVQHCEVTLRGEVDERYAKHLAEDLAGQVWGVRDVHNQLRIRRHDDTGLMSGAASFHAGSTSNPTLTAPGGEPPRREHHGRESTDQGAPKA